MQDFLNQLTGEHGSVDLEWLRDVLPDEANVECVRLLTLHHLAFPINQVTTVDANIACIAIRLEWVPLRPLPYNEIFACKYELHYHMLIFGKINASLLYKDKPNCNACSMRGECRHFTIAFASARLALPRLEEKSIANAMRRNIASQNISETSPLSLPMGKEYLEEQQQEARPGAKNDMSKALVALAPEARFIPMPKLKAVTRLRTEHLAFPHTYKLAIYPFHNRYGSNIFPTSHRTSQSNFVLYNFCLSKFNTLFDCCSVDLWSTTFFLIIFFRFFYIKSRVSTKATASASSAELTSTFFFFFARSRRIPQSSLWVWRGAMLDQVRKQHVA
ncbi:hypothetical protein ACJRO7_031898, partial [Eucalyptus globulus]